MFSSSVYESYVSLISCDELIGSLLWLIYLLLWIPNTHCLVADDSLVSVIWSKHGFQRQMSNFNWKFARFQWLWSKKNLL